MTEQAISPLRRCMTEDVSIRKFAAKTQHDYEAFRWSFRRSPSSRKLPINSPGSARR